jgi:hypothetical protein
MISGWHLWISGTEIIILTARKISESNAQNKNIEICLYVAESFYYFSFILSIFLSQRYRYAVQIAINERSSIRQKKPLKFPFTRGEEIKWYERRWTDWRINYSTTTPFLCYPNFATRCACQSGISVIEPSEATPLIFRIIMPYCAIGRSALIYPFRAVCLLHNTSIDRIFWHGRCQLNAQWVLSGPQTERQDWRGIRVRNEVLQYEQMFLVPLGWNHLDQSQ